MKRDQNSIKKRHNDIVNLLKEQKELKVDEIAEIFSISLMTVRRDLQQLEEQGLIRRFHGGARILSANLPDTGLEAQKDRDAISRFAATLIEEGDSIFINGSLTASGMLEYIGNKKITVITNNAFAAGYVPTSSVQISLLGGHLNGHIMTGDYCMRNLLTAYVNKAFLGCTGISQSGEILCDIPSELGINETMISHADSYYILVDHRKLGKTESSGRFTLQRPGTIITDAQAPAQIVQVLEEKGMKVILIDSQSKTSPSE